MEVVVLVRVLRLLRQIGHLRAIEVNIACDVVRQTVSCLVTIAQVELHTPVLQRRTIDPRLTTKADGTEEGRLNEHVLGLLEEQVVRTIEFTTEEREVGTEVPL